MSNFAAWRLSGGAELISAVLKGGSLAGDRVAVRSGLPGLRPLDAIYFS